MDVHSQPKFLIFALVLVVISTFALQIYYPVEKSTDIRSKAAGGNTLTVCEKSDSGCAFVGGEGIQQAVDAAKDGDTIIIKSGTYTRRTYTPIANEKFDQCFVHTKGKNLTIRGEGFGSLIFSENDEIGTGVTGLSRTIICIQGGNVTLDSVHLKQSLRHAINISNAQAVIKNVWTDDIDNIPVMVRLNSRVAFVNNFINGPMNIDDGSRVVVINNTFCGGGVNLNLCRDRFPAATIINNIFSLTNGGVYGVSVYGGNCGAQPDKLKSSKINNNLIWRNKDRSGCDTNEICDFSGKVEADPLYESFPGECAYGDVGIVGWAHNYHLKEGSPGKTAGDPSIAAEVGMYGGICTEGANSGNCENFISQQLNQLDPPASPTPIEPTMEPTVPFPTDFNPTTYNPQPTTYNPQPSTPQNPPITYYLPPTVSYNQPTVANQQPTTENLQPTPPPEATPTPTITPTPRPLIDIKKTLNETRSILNTFVSTVIKASQTILP